MYDVNKWKAGTSEIAQQVRESATKPEYLSSAPKTHVVEGENDPNKLSTDFQTGVMTQASPVCPLPHMVLVRFFCCDNTITKTNLR